MAIAICSLSLWSCDGIDEQDKYNLISEAETADLRRAYELHEKLYLSTIPSDTSLVSVLAKHGRPARDLALEKAVRGNRDELYAAIPVILETRDSLNVRCSKQEAYEINDNVAQRIQNGKLRSIVRQEIAIACGEPLTAAKPKPSEKSGKPQA